MTSLVRKYNNLLIIGSFLVAMASDYFSQGDHAVAFLLPIIITAITQDLPSSVIIAVTAWLASYLFFNPNSFGDIISRLVFFVFDSIITNIGVKKQTFIKDSLIRELNIDLDLSATLRDLLLNYSKAAIEVIDASGKIINWNEKAKEMTGFNYALNQFHAQLFSPLLNAGQNTILETLKSGKEYMDLEIILPVKGKLVTALVDTYTLRDKSHKIIGVLAIYRDITKRKNRERQIQQAEKFAALGQMAAGLAHEIRNPLTTVKGFLQLASPNNPKYFEYRDLMLDEVNRTNKLISDFILLANPSAPIFRRFPLYNLIEEVFQQFADEATKQNVDLINLVAPSHFVTVDIDQFQHLLVCLTNNALDAMPSGGNVTIRADVTSAGLKLDVSDTGIGIPKEVVDKVFDPFFTTKDLGTGLGLSICYHIVNNHGGHINVYSSLGEGTIFSITIPQKSPQSVQTPENRNLDPTG